MIDYANELNPSQLSAVECCDCPMLVIAGAGSGKTRVLTHKIAYLLEHGYEPYNLLALTFTNKAAGEMRDRIGNLVGPEKARWLWMGTFHSIFARILRQECERLGYGEDFTIYDQKDSEQLVKQVVREMQLDEKRYKEKVVHRHISQAKNGCVTAAQYGMSPQLVERDRMAQLPMLYKVYEAYDRKLRQSNAMDFDDLLLNTYTLFLQNDDVRHLWQERFRYVLVDEYQDTNLVQHRIVLQLTEDNHMVCVVGDDAQSIYSFRGAVVDNILRFNQHYPGTRIFKLERNYRSSQNIVAAANSLIGHNSRQIRKNVYSELEEGYPIEVCEAYGDKEEVAIVARKLDALSRRKGFRWSDVAILYRTNAQSRVFEEEFRRRGFPYRIVGGLSFYQRAEIKDAVAYLRLAINPHDEVSLLRVINKPARGIGQTTMDKATHCALDNGVTTWDIINSPATFGLDVNASKAQKLQAFAEMLDEAHDMASRGDAAYVAKYIIHKSGLYQSIFSSHEVEDEVRQQNMQELLDGITAFVKDNVEQGEDTSLATYLQNISLMSDADDGNEDTEEGRIALMTAHAAKGLEFPIVFIVGLEEGLFPAGGLTGMTDTEEERRLFYVAMTRTKQRLFLTWSHERMRNGRYEYNSRSRFIGEIDAKYIKGGARKTAPADIPSWAMPHAKRPVRPTAPRPAERPQTTLPPGNFRRVQAAQSPAAPAATPDLRVGQRVLHARFGMGRVTSLEGTGVDAKAVVEFDNSGTRTLLLRFARLETV